MKREFSVAMTSKGLSSAEQRRLDKMREYGLQHNPLLPALEDLKGESTTKKKTKE